MAASRTACSHLPWMALPVLLLSATMAWGAPVMKVTEVRVGQQPAKSASVKIFYPNEKKSATKDLAVGDGLDPGVEIVVPANTEITLTSLNGNVIKVQPNTQFKVIGVSDKGETFNVQL